MELRAIVLLLALTAALAAEDSCISRCENGFDSKMKCQCDTMCRYYKSCCSDYESMCGIKTRGDMFAFAEDDDEQLNSTTPGATPSSPEATPITRKNGWSTSIPVVAQTAPDRGTTTKLFIPTVIDTTTAAPTMAPPTTAAPPTRAPDPEADACSGRSFDSFMQLKNGSIFAFRGDYFFELDEKAVLPGYPKLIKEVWGISGPIDAAFTRVNCQGKTYIFKGNKYWRFEDGVLDDDYPRDISVGFEKIPDDVDAAFAIPATNHHDKEKVYFFKGDQYYQYEFLHQPTHEECSRMNKVSPSVLFTRYTDLHYDHWEKIFSQMFQGIQSHHGGPRFINQDWVGIRSPVDAVMVGRLYITPRPQPPPRQGPWGMGGPWGVSGSWGVGSQGSQGSQRRRQNRSPQWSLMAEWGADLGQDYAERFYRRESRRQDQDQDQQRGGYHRQQQQQQQHNYDYDYRHNPHHRTDLHSTHKGQPVQNIYFFKKDKYYRVDLQTKRVDFASPPYPRSIGKYWLGCPDSTGAEKR